MAEYTSLSALMSKIQSDINKTLATNVADTVKEHISNSVVSSVYGEAPNGEPDYYVRRGSPNNFLGTGSLGDPNEMDAIVEGNTLSVTDNAQPKKDWGMDLDYAIEYGYSDKKDWWDKPRPFISDTILDLKKDSAHTKAMKKGLQDLGYKVTNG